MASEKKAERPPTDDEVAARWAEQGVVYQNVLETAAASVGRCLVQALRIHHAPPAMEPTPLRVLELGCGSGAVAMDVVTMLRQQDEYTLTDLTEAMVAGARLRMKAAQDAGLCRAKLTIQTADAQALPFADASYNRVFANLCLQIVPDPEKMLKEAFRVLEPGGIAAFSVWGKEANTPNFALPTKVLQSMGLDKTDPSATPARTNFHLNNPTTTRQLVQSVGFRKVITWFNPAVMEVFTGQEYADRMLQFPSYARMLNGMPADVAEKYRKELIAEADAVIDSGNPMSLDTLVVVALK